MNRLSLSDKEPYISGFAPVYNDWISLKSKIREHRLNGENQNQSYSNHIKYRDSYYWKQQIKDKFVLTAPSNNNSIEEDSFTFSINSVDQVRSLIQQYGNYPALKIVFHSVINCEYLNVIISSDLELLDVPIDQIHQTMLHHCANADDELRLRFLLELGAKPNIFNDRHRTPLHLSIHPPHHQSISQTLSITRLLLDHGADINAEDLNGKTPLHLACAFQFSEMIELLLQRGARVHVFDKQGLLPIHLVQRIPHIVSLFHENSHFAGHHQHTCMWAYLTSRELVQGIISSMLPSCPICHRKLLDCRVLKRENYRYWSLVHGKFQTKQKSMNGKIK